MTPQTIADALTRAGIDKLPPPARAYLFQRITQQIAGSSFDPDHNLGGLRNLTFGAAKTGPVGQAHFPDIDSAARALVSVSYRAAPRDWGAIDPIELARLGRYPIHPRGDNAVGPPVWLPIKDLQPLDVGEFKWSYLIPAYGPYAVVRDYIGPSDEAEKTFRGLVGDWVAFDRLGVGRMHKYADGTLVDLTEGKRYKTEWDTFRKAWENGDIPGNELGGQLNVQVSNANAVRKLLKENNVSDPELGPGLRAGLDVTKSTAALARSEKIEDEAKKSVILEWLTNPAQSETQLPFGPKVPSRVLYAMLASLGVAGLLALGVRSGAERVKVIVQREDRESYRDPFERAYAPPREED